MKAGLPAVSIVMQVYNGERYLGEAIEAALGQTWSDFELIVVESGSSDGTAEVLRHYAALDDRIRLIELAERQGRGPCANLGIAAARAPLVARMDADDISLPERLERQVDWMRRRDVGVCGTHFERFGAADEIVRYPEHHEGVLSELCFSIALNHSAAMVRTSILREEPYIDTAFEDYELWTRLCARHRMENVPEVLQRLRVHDAQNSWVNGAEVWRDLQRYRFRHVYRMFPGTPLDDYLALARLSDRKPHATIAELERAGRWLVRLAQPADPWLRAILARRWASACERSTGLGPEVERARERYAAELASLGAAAAA